MSVWNWIQVAVAIIAALIATFAKGMNKWLGFILIVGAGVLMIIMSIVSKDYRFLGLGIFAILLAILALIVSATIEPAADDDTLGGQVSNMPAWAWIVSVVLFIGALVPVFVLKAPPNTSGQVPPGQTSEPLKKAPPKTAPKR
jgi:putative Mn2+ efflux pump MntP